MKQLHIFRAGIHQPMQGGALEFREADLAATAAAYDPALGEAPLVVGHPKTDAPAYGWVRALRAEGGDLVAEPHQVEPAFAEMVQAGRFKKISASFYTPNHPSNPKPGAFYLKHVGFLGAAAPAVKGLRDVAFAADEADVVTLEFAADGAVSGWRRFIPAWAGNTQTAPASIFQRSVHPRVGGEHSCRNPLIPNPDSDFKELTNFSPPQREGGVRLVVIGPALCGSAASGPKATKRKPSRSSGTRRFAPQVSNSKPTSFGADQAITALPSSMCPVT